MNSGFVVLAIETVPQLLAVQRDDFALAHRAHTIHPGQKAGLELLRVNGTKHAPEGIGGRNALRQLQKPAQPLLFGFAKCFHGWIVIASADHRADANHQNVNQFVNTAPFYSRIV
jgi:hypothetical protein